MSLANHLVNSEPLQTSLGRALTSFKGVCGPFRGVKVEELKYPDFKSNKDGFFGPGFPFEDYRSELDKPEVSRRRIVIPAPLLAMSANKSRHRLVVTVGELYAACVIDAIASDFAGLSKGKGNLTGEDELAYRHNVKLHLSRFDVMVQVLGNEVEHHRRMNTLSSQLGSLIIELKHAMTSARNKLIEPALVMVNGSVVALEMRTEYTPEQWHKALCYAVFAALEGNPKCTQFRLHIEQAINDGGRVLSIKRMPVGYL